jgi:hypothetical protein
MARIHKQYYSMYELWLRDSVPGAAIVYEYLYPEQVNRYKDLVNAPFNRDWRLDRNQKSMTQPILGGFQPLIDIGKDVTDTYKPYKSSYHIKRDFLQPLRGVKNIVKGVINIIGAPIYFVLQLFESLSSDYDRHRFGLIRFRSALTFSWVLEGVASIVRGITQIVATPLTWLVKMPFRGLVTAIYSAPKIEESASIQRVATTGNAVLQNRATAFLVEYIRYELHRKFLKAHRRGQKTDIDPVQELASFTAQNPANLQAKSGREKTQIASQYIGLFKKEVTEKKQPAVPAADANKVRIESSTRISTSSPTP